MSKKPQQLCSPIYPALHIKCQLRPPHCLIHWVSDWPAAVPPTSCCVLDTCGWTVSTKCLVNRCDSLHWWCFLLSGSVRLCVRLSLLFFLSSLGRSLPVCPCFFVYGPRRRSLPVGPWIRVGRAVLDPHRGPATAGVVRALGVGRGPVAVTAFAAWWRGAARPGAGRRSRATCMPEAFGLASEWRMVTGKGEGGGEGREGGGKHEGLQWAQEQHGVEIKEECESHEWHCCMFFPQHGYEATCDMCRWRQCKDGGTSCDVWGTLEVSTETTPSSLTHQQIAILCLLPNIQQLMWGQTQTKWIHSVILFLRRRQFTEGCDSLRNFKRGRCSQKIFRNSLFIHLM